MEEQKVKEIVNAIYEAAGVQRQFSGSVNDRVAEVVGIMLHELGRCSDVFAWVPRPPAGKATITWIARNISRSMVDRLRDSDSLTCLRGVVHRWGGQLQRAGMGL
ncbi:hypothetical protein B1C78_04995 [Thioalkalivibrio denitrificans]|uniref:Uncharacterized protein n=1 Tax=Thioalkalivibrio denitrificans TaxID=108003 RepID=A0A1V3NN39_9GAMM|nr:hypothetical protein B1C78_04995 [Thioalkalivibrio denitrificans]